MSKQKEKPISKMSIDELANELAESAFCANEGIRHILIKFELERRLSEEKKDQK